jgi:hypothetical protein
MFRVPVSAEVSVYIGARIAAFSQVTHPQLLWQAAYVNKFIALPLYAGWIETVGLRAVGEFIS